jgi:hypothetical protein
MIAAKKFIAILLEDEPLFDPDASADPKAEMNRLLPTKTVTLKGNSMLFAPGVIKAALVGWKTSSKKQRKWASDVLHAWPGLDEDDYRRILNGHADIKADGNSVIITIKLWK